MQSIQLQGDVTLLHRFKQLPAKMQKKHCRRGVAKAARRLVKAAKTRAPVDSGQLKRSLGYRPKTYKQNVLAIVGPRKGFRAVDGKGKAHDPAKIAHLVEMGHAGPHPARAKPFLRPAFDELSPTMIAMIAAEMRAGLEQEARG